MLWSYFDWSAVFFIHFVVFVFKHAILNDFFLVLLRILVTCAIA